MKKKSNAFFKRENSNLSYSKINMSPKLTESAVKAEITQIVKVSWLFHLFLYNDINGVGCLFTMVVKPIGKFS